MPSARSDAATTTGTSGICGGGAGCCPKPPRARTATKESAASATPITSISRFARFKVVLQEGRVTGVNDSRQGLGGSRSYEWARTVPMPVASPDLRKKEEGSAAWSGGGRTTGHSLRRENSGLERVTER